MDDDKSTVQDAPDVSEVIDSPEVVDAPETTGEQPITDPSEDQPDASSAPEVDDKLRKYAENQGIELDSPGAIKAATLAMSNQSEKTKAYQKATELEKTATAISDEDAAATAQATGQDPELIKRLQRVEVKEAVRDFWSNPDHDASMESKMVDVLATKPYLAGDLDSLYAVAVHQSGGVAAVKSQAKKDTLSELAHKQQATVPRGNATTSGSPKEKSFSDLSISEMEKKLGFVRQ